jgi:2'-phosphotransferase
VESDAAMVKITNPFEYSQIIHGTYMEPLPLIMQSGLNRMGRNHTHLAIGLPGNGVISGMRSSCEVVIDINMTKAMHGPHKIPFWISANKVVLAEGLEDGSIPTDYFRYVMDFRMKKYLYQTPFDYICVFDFECTCYNDDANKLKS